MKVLNVKNKKSENKYYGIRIYDIMILDEIQSINKDLRKLNLSVIVSAHKEGLWLPCLVKDTTKLYEVQRLILQNLPLYNKLITFGGRDSSNKSIYLEIRSYIDKYGLKEGYKLWWLESLESSIELARKKFDEDIKKYKKSIDNILKSDII